MGKQLEFKTHGGRRRNAGRTNRTGRPGHAKRPRVDGKKPLHITLKCTPNLRRPRVFKKMSEACKRARHFGLNVLQFAMLCDHIHLIVEAADNRALTLGVKSLTNKLAKRFGTRFRGRYHLRLINTPTQMKHTYRYVLLNYSKHSGEPAHLDAFATGNTFTKWDKLARLHGDGARAAPETSGLAEPRTWLARVGWLRAA